MADIPRIEKPTDNSRQERPATPQTAFKDEKTVARPPVELKVQDVVDLHHTAAPDTMLTGYRAIRRPISIRAADPLFDFPNGAAPWPRSGQGETKKTGS